MEDLGKINSMQLYYMWKNLTVGLVTLIATLTISKLLPSYVSPVVALVCAAFLYVYIFNSRISRETSCMIVPYSLLYCLMAYAFLSILANVLYAWRVRVIPQELVFFTSPFIPSLLLCPVCFVTLFIMKLRQRSLHICSDCKMRSTSGGTNPFVANLLTRESHFQLRNLILLFGVLSVCIWSYYLVFYVNININARDWYIFTWLTVIFFVLDEVYYIARYYNLYLDLQENNEIITPEELSDMTAKTYLRFYVICGNNVFIDPHGVEKNSPYKEVYDTPFFTKRTMNGITSSEVKKIISRMTGYDNGELRFFYGRKADNMGKHSILRYFYFLDGDVSDYQNMNVEGEWMDFEKIKYLYTTNRGKLAQLAVTDTTRLATIILTEKTFDEDGFRKSKIKMYSPTFNLIDVRNSEIDFQDDKWIEISMFNSDTPMFRLKKWWRGIMSKNRSNGSWQ